MSDLPAYFPPELIDNMQGLIGALTTQMGREPTKGLQSGYAVSGAPSCENIAVPTHCFRTVSQRSLSTPTSFLSLPNAVAANNDLYVPITTGANGAIIGATPGGAPIDFNDANVQPQRARVDQLVLIGMRTRTVVWMVTNDTVVFPSDVGEFPSAMADIIRNNTVLRVYHTSDESDPWIDDTPLAYFERPAGEFVAVPPVIWKDRDPKMQIQQRFADFGALAGAVPVLTVPFNSSIGLNILVEALFIPNPDLCGDYWPGQACPRNRVKGAQGYIGV